MKKIKKSGTKTVTFGDLETLLWSGHLKILRTAGLVIAEERFPYTFYSIDEKNMNKAEVVLIKFFNQLKEPMKKTGSPLQGI